MYKKSTMKRFFGFSQPVFVLGIVSLLTDLSSEMIYPVIPLFLANTIGASTAFIGLIEGVAESTASLLKVFSGWLSDRLNKRKELILLGYGLSSITKPFLALATSGWHVLGIRFADRLGKGVRGAPRDALIADAVEPSDRGRSFGFHRAMDTTGAIIGPALAFMLLPLFNNNYRPLFLMAAVPALIGVVIIIMFVKDLKRPEERIRAEAIIETNTGKAKVKLSKDFIVLLIITGIFTLGNSSDAFLLLRAQSSGVATVHIPLIWLCFNLVYTLVAIPAGKWSDRVGRKTVIITGLTIYSISYLGFAFINSAWQAWALFGVYGLYYGMTDGVIRAYIADVIPKESRATSYGVYNFVVGVLLFPANLLTGWIWKVVSPEAAFSLGAGLSITAAIGFALFTKGNGSELLPKKELPA